MAKSLLRKLLEKKLLNQAESRKAFNTGSTGKLGNSRKPVTAVQKHKGKGY